MKAFDRHKAAILKYIGDWNNPFPKRCEMPGICGIAESTLYQHFSPADLQQIENEGLELRKRQSAFPRSELYEALHREGKAGNIAAIKEYLDRTEGKVTEKHEHTGKNGKPIKIEKTTFEIIKAK